MSNKETDNYIKLDVKTEEYLENPHVLTAFCLTLGNINDDGSIKLK